MSQQQTVEQQYRVLLFTLAGLTFVGTSVELFLVGHTQSSIQLVPLFLCGFGFISIIATGLKPSPKKIRIHNIIMIVILVGGVFGVYEHLEHNMEFELEIRPNAVASDVIWETLQGTSPMMAPGILPFAAILGYAATWRHSVLNKN